MTVGGIGSGINSIQFLRARQAFENTNKLAKNEEILKDGFGEEDVKLSISSQDIKIQKQPEEIKKDEFEEKNNQKMGEIKQFIAKNNCFIVNDEDLKYALSTGRSVLADYTA